MLFRYNDFTETVELGQRIVYIDVSQIEHSLMRMNATNFMRIVKSLLANCNLYFFLPFPG